MSELSKDYTLFWGVPTKAVVEPASKSMHPFRVAYDLDVLESFNQINADKLTVYSYGVHGSSCGIQLQMGSPQFLAAFERFDEEIEVSVCTPKLPYDVVKKYLITGVDTFVPSLNKCISNDGNLNTGIKDCRIWESSYENWRIYGLEDLQAYQVKWAEHSKENPPNAKKPWWRFWKR